MVSPPKESKFKGSCYLWCLSHDSTSEKSPWWLQDNLPCGKPNPSPNSMEVNRGLESHQKDADFTLANKLKRKNTMWTKHKMNVSLSAQKLSASVLSSIDFLREDIHLPEFENSEYTTDVIRRIDTACNFLNSRNPLAKGTKTPGTFKNLQDWSYKCKELAHYIIKLRDQKGHYLQSGGRKSVIWGFAFCLHSIVSLIEQHLQCTNHPYKFVLTYKFSQDHIELLLNKIRWCCG